MHGGLFLVKYWQQHRPYCQKIRSDIHQFFLDTVQLISGAHWGSSVNNNTANATKQEGGNLSAFSEPSSRTVYVRHWLIVVRKELNLWSDGIFFFFFYIIFQSSPVKSLGCRLVPVVAFSLDFASSAQVVRLLWLFFWPLFSLLDLYNEKKNVNNPSLLLEHFFQKLPLFFKFVRWMTVSCL